MQVVALQYLPIATFFFRYCRYSTKFIVHIRVKAKLAQTKLIPAEGKLFYIYFFGCQSV